MHFTSRPNFKLCRRKPLRWKEFLDTLEAAESSWSTESVPQLGLRRHHEGVAFSQAAMSSESRKIIIELRIVSNG